MITLTTPHNINSVLGGNAPIAYNRLVLAPFTMDAAANTVSGRLRLTSITNPTMQAIYGTLNINLATGLLTIDVPQIDFLRQVTLTAPQITSVTTILANAQNGLEGGLVSLGVVAGTQSTGT